jgi:hypothetical protein
MDDNKQEERRETRILKKAEWDEQIKTGSEKVFHIKIYKAAESYLYLPLYIIEDLDIFKTILKPVVRDNPKLQENYDAIVIDFSPKTDSKEAIKGDKNAIDEMLKHNDDTVAIAIGSPIGFLNKENASYVLKEAKVVGAVINRATFWAVSKEEGYISEIDEFKNNGFTNVICPNNEFITINYFGQLVKEKGVENIKYCNFGDEFNYLATEQDIAITADLAELSVFTVQKKKNRSYGYINHKFTESQGEFLTTGIITSKKSCEKFPGIIEKIIESIQTAIAILYSSEKTAKRICTDIANKYFKEKFNQEIQEDSPEIQVIIDRIYEERFYPDDLRVSSSCWSEAIDTLKLEKLDTKEKEASFTEYVDNNFVLKSINKKIGVDLEVSSKDKCKRKDKKNPCPHYDKKDNEVKALEDRLKNLKVKNDDLQREHDGLQKGYEDLQGKYNKIKWFFIILASLIVIIIVFLVIKYFFNFLDNIDPKEIMKITVIAAGVTVLSIVVGGVKSIAKLFKEFVFIKFIDSHKAQKENKLGQEKEKSKDE